MTVVSLDMAYRSFLEVLAGSHPPRYAASLKPSSPRFTHSSSAGEAASKAIEEALKKALKDIERFADDVGDSSPEASSVASGASEPRRLNLAVETEPHKQHVVGLSKASPTAEALSVAMSNALLAPYVVHAYKIGTQPIAVLSVPKSEVAPLEEGMKISKTISWFEPDPCWSKQEIDDAW